LRLTSDRWCHHWGGKWCSKDGQLHNSCQDVGMGEGLSSWGLDECGSVGGMYRGWDGCWKVGLVNKMYFPGHDMTVTVGVALDMWICMCSFWFHDWKGSMFAWCVMSGTLNVQTWENSWLDGETWLAVRDMHQLTNRTAEQWLRKADDSSSRWVTMGWHEQCEHWSKMTDGDSDGWTSMGMTMVSGEWERRWTGMGVSKNEDKWEWGWGQHEWPMPDQQMVKLETWAAPCDVCVKGEIQWTVLGIQMAAGVDTT
jgi:hypothetical protein